MAAELAALIFVATASVRSPQVAARLRGFARETLLCSGHPVRSGLRQSRCSRHIPAVNSMSGLSGAPPAARLTHQTLGLPQIRS
jgi:hypothetical protein